MRAHQHGIMKRGPQLQYSLVLCQAGQTKRGRLKSPWKQSGLFQAGHWSRCHMHSGMDVWGETLSTTDKNKFEAVWTRETAIGCEKENM